MSEELVTQKNEVEEVEEVEVEEIDLSDCEYIFRHYRVVKFLNGELVHYQRGATQWIPAPRGGFTECFLQRKTDKGENGELIGYGFALCSVLDPYCYRSGRQISRGRARKMAMVGLNPCIWDQCSDVSDRRNAEYAPFLTVEEAHEYLEAKLPLRFPFLED